MEKNYLSNLRTTLVLRTSSDKLAISTFKLEITMVISDEILKLP